MDYSTYDESVNFVTKVLMRGYFGEESKIEAYKKPPRVNAQRLFVISSDRIDADQIHVADGRITIDTAISVSTFCITIPSIKFKIAARKKDKEADGDVEIREL